jgi:hypothetical protein
MVIDNYLRYDVSEHLIVFCVSKDNVTKGVKENALGGDGEK